MLSATQVSSLELPIFAKSKPPVRLKIGPKITQLSTAKSSPKGDKSTLLGHTANGVRYSLHFEQVILSVIGLIALAVVIMTPADDGPRYPGRKINVEDLISINFRPKAFNRTWVSGELDNETTRQTISIEEHKNCAMSFVNMSNMSSI